jgi:hypothetical protein
VYFFKIEQKKNWQLKKQKKPSESLENCTTSDAEILNKHFSLLFKNQKEKWRKKTR